MTTLLTIVAVALVVGTVLTLAEGIANIVEMVVTGMTKTSEVSEEKLANVNWEVAFAAR